MLRSIFLAALLGLCASASPAARSQTAASSLQVSVSGAVQRPGDYRLPTGSRYADAVLAAMPNQRAYSLGAALLRQEARREQARLKTGLLFDLQTLAAEATNPAMAEAAAQLHSWLQPLPVTGRVPALLEPRALEIDVEANRPLAEGDRFVYPLRPDTIRVVGAVAQTCVLTHVPLRDAKAYLRDCPPTLAADRDLLYLIQPDGHVEHLGIAAWNRSPAQALAPGAIVYVPLSAARLRALNPAFNRELASFIATQLLPAPGVEP